MQALRAFWEKWKQNAYCFFYGKGVRKQIGYAMRQLKEEPVFLDFLCERWTSLDCDDTVVVIEGGVRDGIVTWQELDTTLEQITALYMRQFSGLIALYELSFPMEYWKSYQHAADGLRSFYRISYGPNDKLLEPSVFFSVRRNFAKVIYSFLRTEGSKDKEATSILMNLYHYSEGELCLIRWPDAITSTRITGQIRSS